MENVIINNVSLQIKNRLIKSSDWFKDLEEIRIRVGKALIIKKGKNEYYITDKGLTTNIKDGYSCTKKDINQTLDIMTKRSYYAVEEDIKKGFLTLAGGHRVGITGKVIIEKGKIKGIKEIMSMNIRISREVKGCSNKVMPYIFSKEMGHTLIISSPGCGKTTLLRDLIKNISNRGVTVGVVDERSEISASHNGEMQIDLGSRTDVLENCPKSLGMMMLLRSMSPNVIAVDEIGSEEDIKSINMLLNAGVKILATVHSKNIDDVKNKKIMNELISNKTFDKYIVLTNAKKIGQVEGVYDKNLKKMWGE